MLNITKRSEIILHFNKMHLQDSNIPMWVIKVKGETHYVHHVDVEAGIGLSTKETPDNQHTKGSLKFKGKLEITHDLIARIYK
jgi:hypothetical protein